MDKGPFRASELYEYAGNLKEYGHDLRLNMYCRMNKSGDHKIELYDVGTKTKSEILREISEIFDFDPLDAGVMRIDLAVDIHGVPLKWFRESVRVMHKRFVHLLPTGNFSMKWAKGKFKLPTSANGRICSASTTKWQITAMPTKQ